MPNPRFLIYGLLDPRDGQLHYVGKSSSGLKRAKAHSRPSALKRDHTRTGNWIKSLISQGLKYNISVIQFFETGDCLCAAEIFWISHFKMVGCELYNHTLGGEGATGRKVSEETRAKIRAANMGNKNGLGKHPELTDEQRKDLSDRAKRRSADPEIRAKISATLTGRKQSPEEISNRVAALRLRYATRQKKSMEIQDAEGNIYRGQKEAAEHFGFTISYISALLRKPNRFGLKRV